MDSIQQESAKKLRSRNDFFQLFPIVFIAALVRVVFYFGHVFSDDSYYLKLASSFLNGSYPDDYLGYPAFLLRKFNTLFTSLSLSVFGVNEIATIIFPFIFSILNIIIVYYLTYELIGNKRIALISSYLTAFFPLEIAFATINFTDAPSITIINLSLLLLLKAVKSKDVRYSIYSGILLGLSFLFKESAYYILITLLIFTAYLKYKKMTEYKILVIVLTSFAAVIFSESIYYFITQGDFLYRINTTEKNYSFCYYNFFPFVKASSELPFGDYLILLLNQIFVKNISAVFFRSFLLGVPLAAFIISLYQLWKKENTRVAAWFLIMLVLMISWTTSITSYKPLDIRFAWYVFPLFTPAIILVAIALSKFKIQYRNALLFLYMIYSIFMVVKFQSYLGLQEKNQLKEFVSGISDRTIVADHHTLYGLQLFVEKESNNKLVCLNDINEITFKEFENPVLIYNKDNVDELALQGIEYNFEKIIAAADFRFYMNYGKYKIYLNR